MQTILMDMKMQKIIMLNGESKIKEENTLDCRMLLFYLIEFMSYFTIRFTVTFNVECQFVI